MYICIIIMRLQNLQYTFCFTSLSKIKYTYNYMYVYIYIYIYIYICIRVIQKRLFPIISKINCSFLVPY